MLKVESNLTTSDVTPKFTWKQRLADASRDPAHLRLCGWLTGAIYAVFLAYFSFANGLFIHVKPVGSLRQSLAQNLLEFLLFPALLLLYRQGFKSIDNSSPRGIRQIVLPAIIFSVLTVCTPIFHSTDVFSYIAPGWQQVKYHINPYVITTVCTPGFGVDPLLTCNPWALNPIPYGFTFAHIARMICALGQGDMSLTVNLFKALNWSVYMCLALVVYQGAKLLKIKRPDLCLYLYMWNPLILFESLSNIHNDILMTFPVMLAFLCAVSRFSLLSLPILAVGILVKYAWGVAFPFLFLFLAIKRGWKNAAGGLALSALTAALISWRYLRDWQKIRWFDLHLNLQVLRGSLVRALSDILDAVNRYILHGQAASLSAHGVTIAKNVVSFAFLALMAWCLWKAIKARKSLTLIRVMEISVLVMTFYICFVAPRLFGWYFVMFLPVALWLPEGSELRRLAIILSCAQLFSFTFLGEARIVDYLLMTGIPVWLSLRRLRQTTKEQATIPITLSAQPV